MKYNKVRIGDVGKVVTGRTPKTNDKSNYGEDFMFIGPSDLHEHFLINKSEKMISAKGLKTVKSAILNDLSILVGCIGWDMGNVALVNAKCVTNQQINSITNIKELYNPYYIYYWLKTKKAFLFQRANVTRTPILNKSDFSEIEIDIPERAYQNRIVEFLVALDTKIELNNKINAELEAMAKLIYDYWFVQFDFPIDKSTAEKMGNPSLEGKPYKASGGKMVYNKELKRDIPEGWEAVALKKVLDCNKNTLKKNNGYKVLRYLDTSNLTKNVINELKELVPNVDKIPSRAQRIVGENDILFSTVRPNQCHYGLIKQPVSNLIASTGYAQLSSKDKLITNDLIYSFLTTKWVTEQLQRIANLAVTSYPSISPNDILALRIVLPKDREKLSHINQTLTSFNKKISVNNVENQKLSELRDWLLPMLMNGQVRVKMDGENKSEKINE